MSANLLKKIITMSKYTLSGIMLQFFFLTFIMAEDGYGQEDKLQDIHISCNLEDATLEDAFKAIESQTSFKFAYKKSAIKNQVISKNFDNESLEEILHTLANEGEISFQRINQVITSCLFVIR